MWFLTSPCGPVISLVLLCLLISPLDELHKRMTIEEQLQVLRQNGWRWQRLDDEWFEIQAPVQYAGGRMSLGALKAESQLIHSPFLCDLPEEAHDYPATLAGHLVDYCARHSLSQTELAEHLGCSVSALRKVARVPISQPETIETDLEQAARETGCNAAGLRRLINEQKRLPLAWLSEGGEP